MSKLDQMIDARATVREVTTTLGPMWVRVRAPTSGELIAAQMGGALEPTKRRAKMTADQVDPVMATRQAETLVCICTLGVGDTEAEIEPVTIIATEADKPRPGSRPVPLYGLDSSLVTALTAIAYELFAPEAARAKLAAFPAADRSGD